MRILRGLTSRLLPCGCIAGIYETYDGQVVALSVRKIYADQVIARVVLMAEPS